LRLSQCCLATDGGGALILVAAERARDFPQKACPWPEQGRSICLAPGESVETPTVSLPLIPAKAGNLESQGFQQLPSTLAFVRVTKESPPRAFRVAGARAFAEAGITHNDVDHLTIYDALAHLPIYGLEDLGFVGRGEAGHFIAERKTAPGGRWPLDTNGGGLSYMHSGMYGKCAL
jgi:acetyl-CoA acetyltransferase